MTTNAHNLYQSSKESVRPAFGSDQAKAYVWYKDFVEFVLYSFKRINLIPKNLLDIGCGNGWSTYCFASKGIHSIGVDLNKDAIEPPPLPNLSFQEGSALDIPFPDESFEAITCYQCIEHVPDPKLALTEMVRVCKPGGLIVIVGPNLLSPFLGILLLANPFAWKHLKILRSAELPHHPVGNTFFEIIFFIITRPFLIFSKMIQRKPNFLMRVPDTKPPFHGDNDACYLCNPIDLIHFFKTNGFKIINTAKENRWRLFTIIRGGTWISVQKPS